MSEGLPTEERSKGGVRLKIVLSAAYCTVRQTCHARKVCRGWWSSYERSLPDSLSIDVVHLSGCTFQRTNSTKTFQLHARCIASPSFIGRRGWKTTRWQAAKTSPSSTNSRLWRSAIHLQAYPRCPEAFGEVVKDPDQEVAKVATLYC